MRGIDDYLRLQEETNNEIHLILLDLETVEKKEKELVYLENKKILGKLEAYNLGVADKTRNEFVTLKNRIVAITVSNETKKLGLTTEISNLFQMVSNLEMKLVQLETKISEVTTSQTHTLKEPTNVPQHLKEENINHTSIKKPEGNSLKLGIGALNLIGIILILISLSTFGRVVYVNFMSKEMKGLTLFVIPILILLLSELYLLRKNYKFSKGITALGISGLYIAVIINYLELENISGIITLVITALITAGAIYLSYKKESNLLRIVTLIGAYICLVPVDNISSGQSYTLLIILIFINILNIYFPLQEIKSKEINVSFEFYTSMLALISTIIIGVNFDKHVLTLLYILITLIYSVQFMITCKRKESTLNSIGILMYFIIYPFSSLSIYIDTTIWYVPLLAYCIIGIAILLRLKNSSKWTGYVGVVITCLDILFRLNLDLHGKYSIVTISVISVLVLSTLMVWLKDKNIFLRVTLIGLVGLSMLNCLININKPISIIYLVLYAAIIYCSKEFKNNIVIIMFKYFYLLIIAGWVFNEINNIDIFNNLQSFIVLSIFVIYTVVINKFDILKHDNIKIMNFISLCFIVFLCIISGLYGNIQFYLTTMLIIYILVSMFTDEYIDNTRFNFNKVLIGALLSTYIVVRLSFIVDVVYEFKQLMLSISLMLVAFGSVFLGFKINNSQLRKYGLILSLITCAKLMLIDFYSFNFIIKTLVFMIVGIIALLISYTFSKLEKEHKNK
ncbi:DUF2339 domain-containing protein [Clostridium estertheticum]|uniref:DUF2339 domain-containing protein n=1 Tax=Clostridium estertheticum TaxID=238834 RepID=UPI001C6E6A61|nr:DUF2339 domain-containing protein [Clostridium estertheticum]MBW9153074.1 DUF2339 domain-containing protein [Clostridium estertheticum]WLC82568.1 DUF2339 domain-containing protein [Clostridium estertheticum]